VSSAWPSWPFGLVVDWHPSPAQRRALPAGVAVSAGPGTAGARIEFLCPAASLGEAVSVGVSAVEEVGLRALRVDAADWVTFQTIADRVARSRETVRLWSLGRLGPDGFPPPLNPGQETSFFSWAEVLVWLRGRRGLDLPEEEPVLAAANLVLQLRALMPRLRDPSVIWRLAGSGW
jgi:hypothetical protein